MDNISLESTRNFAHADKNGSKTRVSELLGESKADWHSAHLFFWWVNQDAISNSISDHAVLYYDFSIRIWD